MSVNVTRILSLYNNEANYSEVDLSLNTDYVVISLQGRTLKYFIYLYYLFGSRRIVRHDSSLVDDMIFFVISIFYPSTDINDIIIDSYFHNTIDLFQFIDDPIVVTKVLLLIALFRPLLLYIIQ